MAILSGAPTWLIYALLAVEIAVGVALNLRFFGSWMTPFNLLALPFAFVVLATIVMSPSLGFVTLQPGALWIWVAGLFAFFAGGIPLALSVGDSIRQKILEQRPLRYLRMSQRIALILGWCVILLLCARFVAIGGIVALADADDAKFAVAYGGGIYGHARTLAFLLTTLLIGTLHRKQWLGWITTFLLLALFTLYTVKSWIFMPLLGGLILRITIGNLRLSVSKLVVVAMLMVVLFFLSYLLTFAAIAPASIYNPATYLNLAHHVAVYLFAGILGWSEFLGHAPVLPAPDASYVFRPFINLISFVSGGEMLSVIGQHWVVIRDEPMARSNVHSLFGTLSIYLGYPGAILYAVAASLFLYCGFAVAVIRRNAWIAALWSFLAAPLILGWFNLYYMHLAFLEVFVYGLLLAGLSWFLDRWLPARSSTSLILGAKDVTHQEPL